MEPVICSWWREHGTSDLLLVKGAWNPCSAPGGESMEPVFCSWWREHGTRVLLLVERAWNPCSLICSWWREHGTRDLEGAWNLCSAPGGESMEHLFCSWWREHGTRVVLLVERAWNTCCAPGGGSMEHVICSWWREHGTRVLLLVEGAWNTCSAPGGESMEHVISDEGPPCAESHRTGSALRKAPPDAALRVFVPLRGSLASPGWLWVWCVRSPCLGNRGTVSCFQRQLGLKVSDKRRQYSAALSLRVKIKSDGKKYPGGARCRAVLSAGARRTEGPVRLDLRAVLLDAPGGGGCVELNEWIAELTPKGRIRFVSPRRLVGCLWIVRAQHAPRSLQA
ncbi:hypothetical protein NDU88_008240 [Pleurodeles waltl]|uniref:Uncharacterized protein n=1 Tax=Pleurodeles waltl TaxID=8319 RepID=A0AAV7NVM1_PLEWA|nr:hypothetical protein NDU88_008240 [Pleurodeles waltl]